MRTGSDFTGPTIFNSLILIKKVKRRVAPELENVSPCFLLAKVSTK
jgi:hypothetical protein